MTTQGMTSVGVNARDRILNAAYDLFSRRGVRAVGVDEVIGRSGVAKATLYRYFPSKNDLVLAFLRTREQRWTIEFVRDQAYALGSTPEQRLLAIFDVFDGWFRRRDEFDSCAFINVLLEMGSEHELGRASIGFLSNIRAIVRDWAEEASLREPAEFAHSWHILMNGSIVAAVEGDTNAARRAQAMGRALIEVHRL